MRSLTSASLLLVLLAAGPALGADPFSGLPGDSKSPATPAAALDDQQKVAEMSALFAAGKYDEVIEYSRTFIRLAKDESARIEATRLVAESLRKKGDWQVAPAAYLKLRDRFEKGADNWVKYDAIADILRTAQAGVYFPLTAAQGKSDPPAPSPTPQTLSDDAVLADALALVGKSRMERAKARIPAIQRCRTPQEVVTTFAGLIEELRQARVLAPNLPFDADHAAAQAAGARLAELGKQATASLNGKLADYQAAIKAGRYTQVQRQEMLNCQNMCTDLAKAEGTFQTGTAKADGAGAWADGGQLKTDSSTRQDAYTKLAASFNPPALNSGSGDYGRGWGAGASPSTGTRTPPRW